jgi:arylsulfatase A-like enzyme
MVNQFVPPGPDRLGFDDYWKAYNFNHSYYNGFYFEDTPEKHDIERYEPDAMTDLLLDYLRDQRRGPFFACISYGTPHQPWNQANVPHEWLKRFSDVEFDLPPNYAEGSGEYWHAHYDRDWWDSYVAVNLTEWMRCYYAMTANLDWNVGRILDALEKQGLDQETLVVFTSDHGEMFGAHGRVQKNIFYEESARVPMLMRLPGVIPAGRRSDACLNTPDLMPTLLTFARAAVPETVEGMDLSHCARDEAGPEPEAALLQGMGPSVDWDDGFEWRALRDKRYTYAVHRAGGSEELYDNRNDPLQMHNLVGRPDARPRLERFREQLRTRMEALNDTFERVTWYRDRWTENGRILGPPR